MKRWLPKNKVLNVLLLGALFAVTSIEFVLIDIPELFPGGARIGSLVHALSLSYIASYIFYVVVVHIKHVRDRQHIHPYIALKTRQLIAGLREITHQIALRAGGDTNVKYPSPQQFDEMTQRIGLADPAPDAYTGAPGGISTWWNFFKYWKALTEDRVDGLFSNSQFLEAEHIQLLLRVRESAFFSILHVFSQSVPNQNCSFLSGALYQLSESTKALDSYCQKHFGNVALFST